MSHVIGIALAASAFLLFSRAIVRKQNGKAFKPVWAFVMILVSLGYQFFTPAMGWSANIAHLLFDFGAGMIIGSFYLQVKQFHPKMLWVPGVLSLVLGGAVTMLSFGLQYFNNDICTRPDRTELLVELGPDDSIDELETVLRKYCAKAEKAFPNVDLSEDEDLAQYYIIYVDSSKRQPLMLELRHDTENVDQLAINNPVELIRPTASPMRKGPPAKFIANDPYLTNQWFADKLAYNTVHTHLKGKKPAKKVLVAIVDTGVDKDHEDIDDIYTKSGGEGDYDLHSHGTHCAGLAGAATNNGKGVGSMNWDGEFISITGYPALDDQGRGTDRRVSNAIINAAEAGADVISMSLGGFSPFGPPKSQVDAIKYARKLGAIVVVAAGNSNDDARRYSPANIEGVITVSAVDEKLNKASFSNTNTKLKRPIAAPGVNILSSVPGSKYQSYNGTSMATPIVAGLIGIMKSLNPDLTTDQVYDILQTTGTKVKDSPRIGKVINPMGAIQGVEGM